MSMYTGRLMVRVHYANAEVKLAAKTILKIAYNQSAMGFTFFSSVIWSGWFEKYILKVGQTWQRPTPNRRPT